MKIASNLKEQIKASKSYSFFIKLLNRSSVSCNNWKRTIIGKSRVKNSHFQIIGRGQIIIGDGCSINGLHILMYGDNSRLEIGNNVIINASPLSPTIMNAFGGAKISIGNGCLFSNGIELHTTDYHSILDNEGHIINTPQDITISEHVWVGIKAIILKGVSIAPNCVIGAGSIITKPFPEPNVIICGNPAQIKKRDINWTRSAPTVAK